MTAGRRVSWMGAAADIAGDSPTGRRVSWMGAKPSMDSLASAGFEPWRKTFDFFDVDNSGTLSVEDFRQCLTSFGQKVTTEHVRQMLREADLDDSGEVEFDEFVKLMTSDSSKKVTMGAVRRYFETLDKDGSGYITAAELRHAYTTLGHGLSDRQMDLLIDRYDLDGNGELKFDEFLDFVRDGHGVEVDMLDDDALSHAGPPAAKAALEPPSPKKPGMLPFWKGKEEKGDWVEVKDKRLAGVLKPMANADGKVKMTDLQAAVDMWVRSRNVLVDPASDPNLHWDKHRAKPGLANVIHKTNHIALVVSDVGRSAEFYAKVIGLQQIRRPNFDRHGAWFTMGNVELHLIKGEPLVHSGKDLIVNHIAIETTDIDRVPEILTAAGVPFRQNVSVPKGSMDSGSGTNSTNNSRKIVKQFFLRDPDGYYLEICDCAVLTKYCLGDINEVAGYDQGISLHLAETAMFVNLTERLAHRASRVQRELNQLCREMKAQPTPTILERLGCRKAAAAVDEEKVKKLIVRRGIYGDICQNETEESLRDILRLANNHVPTAMKVLEIRGWEGAVMSPPAFFEAGSEKVNPEAFLMPKYSIALV